MANSFIPYLTELRRRLIICLIVFGAVFVALWPARYILYDFLSRPMAIFLLHRKLVATAVLSPFWVPVKITAGVACAVSLPFFLWQLWSFIRPALYRREKRLIFPIILGGYALFLLGMLFAYTVIFPIVFHFSATSAAGRIALMTDVEHYWNFVLSCFLSFGLCFELPIIMLIIYAMGFVTCEQYSQHRRYAIVLSFVIAAIISPPDVLSQCLLAVPLCFLYELGIMIVRLDEWYVHRTTRSNLP